MEKRKGTPEREDPIDWGYKNVLGIVRLGRGGKKATQEGREKKIRKGGECREKREKGQRKKTIQKKEE